MIDRPYSLPMGLLLVSSATLSGAYAFQYLGGLQPCTLCLYQGKGHLDAAMDKRIAGDILRFIGQA